MALSKFTRDGFAAKAETMEVLKGDFFESKASTLPGHGSRKWLTPTSPEMSELQCKQAVLDEVHSSCFDHVSNLDRQGCNTSHTFFNLNKNFEVELGRGN